MLADEPEGIQAPREAIMAGKSGHALMRIDDRSQTIIEMVVNGLDSPHSARAYRRALTDFMAWYRGTGQTRLGKATVNAYKKHMLDSGMGHTSINQRLVAIRRMAREAADNGLLTAQVASGIARVASVRQTGQRTGNWLTKRQAEALLKAPDPSTLKGKRDRAILAVLLGCGLRRQEVAFLTVGQIQQRDARWVIVDLVGKRNKVRTVPMPSWAKALIDRWTQAAGLAGQDQGRLFRPVNKADKMRGESLTGQALYNAVARYVATLDLGDVAPHDLRRTFAKLAHKGGGALDQIQLALGHASLKTTEMYLGVQLDLANAACDRLGLSVDLGDSL